MPDKREISTTDPDWSREELRGFWDPGRKLLRAIRRYQALKSDGGFLSSVRARYWVFSHRFWSAVTSCDIPLNVQIEGGLLMPHPIGIVVHPRSKIGPNCLLFQQVTLAGVVDMAGGVDVGAGAKIIGPVAIGERCRIGANAVVTTDAPANTTLVGIPARVVGGDT